MAKDDSETQEIDVFISYKREERGSAVQVGRALNNAGYSYLTDIDLENDEHFADAVDKRLRRSRLILVLWTRKAAASNWVRLEARHGVQQNRYLGIELEPLGNALPFDLEGLNRDVVAAGRPLGKVLPDIVAAVTKRLGDGGAAIRTISDEELDFTADNMAFETAARVDTQTAYREYLARFPNGYMAVEARKRVAQIGTTSHWLGHNKVYLATVVGAVVALGAFGLEAVKERQSAGDLTVSEERGLREQRNQLETKVEELEARIATRAGDPTPEEFAKLTRDLTDFRARETALKEEHRQALEDRDTAHADEAARLKAEAAQNVAALEARLAEMADTNERPLTPDEIDESIRLLEAKIIGLQAQYDREARTGVGPRARRIEEEIREAEGELAGLKARQTALQPPTQTAPTTAPPTDCDAEDGNRGYWLPKDDGAALGCVSVTTTDLNLDKSGMTDAEMPKLAGLTALQSLSLFHTQVSDISALSKLTALQRLSLAATQVSDIAALSQLTALHSLTLSGTQVSDIAALSKLTALQELNIHYTEISDIAALSQLTELQRLSIHNTQVSDIAALSQLTALQWLFIHNTQVSDIAALSQLTALQRLSLIGTQVSDIAALSRLKNLRVLWLPDGSRIGGLADLQANRDAVAAAIAKNDL